MLTNLAKWQTISSWKRQAVSSVKSVVGNWVIIVTPEVEEIKHNKHGWLPCVSTMFVFIFGWITRGRVAYSCNYRHYVIQCPVSHLAWWLSGDRTTIDHLCAAIEFHVHYTTPFVPAAKYYSDNSHAKAVVKSMYTTWNEYIKDGLLFWCVWNCCTHAQIFLQSKHCASPACQ